MAIFMDHKARLLGAIAGKNRGLLTQELDRVAILEAIAKLEDENPTPRPTEAAQYLDGNWRLLYTTSRELLGIDRFPLFQLGQIYQCLRTETQRVYNIAELVGVPWLEGLVCVLAQFEPVSERRVTVQFERSIIGLQRLLRYESPNEIIQQLENGQKFPPLDFDISNRDRQGWIDITYLDDTLRINRGNEGSVFVLAKEQTASLRDG
ncbi:PAP/fibrillin family protein [Spirulina subsalsa CS-330]|nr:PAP/fibrillin family protein [Spirulina subsalsa]MDB9493376.1 PAP/fibrillin family protein [Spirulina subsalsa CS-330]